jgi:uncharacterized protein with von Willebrand factor type A (vWA) domain
MPSPVTNGSYSPPTAPVDRIVGFGRLLRANGVAVSPAEIADALHAVEIMPSVLQTRETLATTLAATMVKRTSDLRTFRKLFSLWFEVERSTPGDHAHLHRQEGLAELDGIDLLPRPGDAMDAGNARHEHGAQINLRQFFGEGVSSPQHDHHASDRIRLTWLGSDLEYDRAGAPPSSVNAFEGSFSLRRVATNGRPGSIRPPSSVEIARAIILSGMRELLDAAQSGDPDDGLLNWLDEHARDVLCDHRAAKTDLWPTVADETALSTLPDLRWDELTVADLVRLDRAIHRLGAKLGGAPGLRTLARTGRLDARRTARRASATGGVPFAPIFRTRRDDRPRLIVLCDASLSVRGAARFLLAISQAAQRQTGRVRTFVFVRQLREVTAILEQRGIEEGIRDIFGDRIIDTSEATDGGFALGDLLRHHADVLTAKTTLLILGDARNNGHDPNLPALAALRGRSRRIIWLTPEQRGTWRLAGCDLPRYAAHCDLVATVRTPADLERLVADMPAVVG